MENTSLFRKICDKHKHITILMHERIGDQENPAGLVITLGHGMLSYKEYHKATSFSEFTDAYIMQTIRGLDALLNSPPAPIPPTSLPSADPEK